MTSVSFFHGSTVNNWGKCPWGGVLARFYGPEGTPFSLGGGEFAHQKIAQRDGQAWNWLIHYSSMFSLKKLYLKSYLFGSKIRINVLIWGGGGGGAYAWSGLYEGAYTWSNTCVKENLSLSVEGPVHGKLIGREIWYFFVAIVQKLPKEWPLITDYNSPTENVSKVPT